MYSDYKLMYSSRVNININLLIYSNILKNNDFVKCFSILHNINTEMKHLTFSFNISHCFCNIWVVDVSMCPMV